MSWLPNPRAIGSIGGISCIGGVCLMFFLSASSRYLRAQETPDLDAHTFRFDGYWFYSQPSGSFHGTGSQGVLDIHNDLNLNSYNTGFARLEWKFTHKNHLYLGFLPVNQSKEVALNRTVVFQGQTYDTGLMLAGRLQ
jgi:hypothetical protein